MTWTGDLATGSGSVSAATSGAFSSLPVSWPSRTEASDGQTSPEELVAAAHASCYAMAFSGILGRAGHPPQRLDVSAEVTFDKLESGWKVVSSALTVHGVVPATGAPSAARSRATWTCPSRRRSRAEP
jgi:osmotically inducible protein OsmC